MTTPCVMTQRSIRLTAGIFGQECAKPGCASRNVWTRPSPCSSRGAMCACAAARRRCQKRHPKRRKPSPRVRPASPKKKAPGWRTSLSGLALLSAKPSRCPMLAAEHRRGQRQMERRAKPARRSSRLIYPKTAARELHQSRSAHKNQNPQNGQLMARFDWGLGAICFGASPVAAVFGSASGSATPPEHRIHFKPSSQAAPLKQDISTLLGIGHFYFALTAWPGFVELGPSSLLWLRLGAKMASFGNFVRRGGQALSPANRFSYSFCGLRHAETHNRS